MAIAPKDGSLAPVEATGFPFAADIRCHVCRHPRRGYIEELMRARCPARQIRRKLEDLGLWAPASQSLANHAKKHLVPRKVLDRIRDQERSIARDGAPRPA
jgi:hypothetical protein